jgi:hypothetical protein
MLLASPMHRNPLPAQQSAPLSSTLLLVYAFLYSEIVPVYSFAVDLGHLVAEDLWFLANVGSIGVELFESSATNGSLGLIRVLLQAIFLLAPCARVEFSNVGQQKKVVYSFILFTFS